MQQSFKILIIDETHPFLVNAFPQCEVVYKPAIQLDELALELADTHILIMRSKLQFTREWIDKSPNLKLIGRLGSGLDNIDTIYAQSKEIVCLNAPEGNRSAVAEHAIGLFLSVLSNIHSSANEVAEGMWDRRGNEGVELGELTVGIIGFGHAGSRLAEMLQGFGCKVLAYDRFKPDFDSSFAQNVALDTIQSQADLISFHPDLNETSFHLFNVDFLGKMNKPFYLFNLSRGGVVNLDAVLTGLKSGKILGLGLDVLENEKMVTYSENERAILNQILDYKQVVITPHIAGITKNAFEKIAKVMAAKVESWMDSNPFLK